MPDALPGRDRAALAERRPQLAPAPRSTCRPADARRASTTTGVALPLRHLDRDDLAVEAAVLDGRDRALVALERERVLPLARHAPALGDVLGGLAHRIRVVVLGELRVDEAPAERRVLQLARAAIPGRFGLRHHVRRPRHRLDAAGDEHVAVADRDRVGGRVDRLQPRAAQPVDGQPADLDREAGQQQPPCGRRRGCPRRPGSRSRGSRPRRGRGRAGALDDRAHARWRPGRRAGPRRARRRSGRRASAPPTTIHASRRASSERSRLDVPILHGTVV